jgi:hypothetical protein
MLECSGVVVEQMLVYKVKEVNSLSGYNENCYRKVTNTIILSMNLSHVVA